MPTKYKVVPRKFTIKSRDSIASLQGVCQINEGKNLSVL